MKRAICALFLLSGCQSIGNLADDLGSHLPVIGERCEHWQCFTTSGQETSDAIKMQREQQEAMPPEQRQQEQEKKPQEKTPWDEYNYQ